MRLILLAVMGQVALFSYTGFAHPGSGIVVDAQGQVFFQDSAARTIWKIDAQGKVTSHYNQMGGHWMALDAKGRFARSDLKLVERISPRGATRSGAALFLTISCYPMTSRRWPLTARRLYRRPDELSLAR